MPEGTVSIDLIKGHGLKDVEFFGKSDPYAILHIGHQNQRSKTINDGGSNPTFNESFLFEISEDVHELQINLYDSERDGQDEAMGSVVFPLKELFVNRQLAPSKFKVQRPDGKFEGELEFGLKFFPKVHHGVLEVHLVEAHGLIDSDTFGTSDPYAIIYVHKEHQKSRVIEGKQNAVWDQKFSFQINSDVTDLLIKLFDQDDFGGDDALGSTVIPLHKVFVGGHVPPSKYKVLGTKGQPQGELSVGLKFSSL